DSARPQPRSNAHGHRPQLSSTVVRPSLPLHTPPQLRHALSPYTTLFRSDHPLGKAGARIAHADNNFSVSVTAGMNDKASRIGTRSEEHTSELQSHLNLVCRLLLEKKTNTHANASGPSYATNKTHRQVLAT